MCVIRPDVLHPIGEGGASSDLVVLVLGIRSKIINMTSRTGH